VRGYPRLARPSQRADLGWILSGLIAWITAISTKSGQAIAANYCGSIWGLGEVSEQRVSVPVGRKYVVESCVEFVRRFVELPNGARIPLRNRKARKVTSSKRRLDEAALLGPRWPRHPTRPLPSSLVTNSVPYGIAVWSSRRLTDESCTLRASFLQNIVPSVR
jgi:hypothetical protein